MNNSNSADSQGPPHSATPRLLGFFPWQQLKSKRISYFTLPLIIMATVVEFVILATGWKYQQIACLPQGMGVTFFGIGPIGATILAVELLKLPLAIWTASRTGWAKGFMLMVGLPLICVLTFQLVKDMAVYEMGTAMAPAGQMLEKATAEEIKISQLNGELAAIEGKKADRERKLAELAAKQAKAKAELEESLKRNGESRQDAISLTDYQKKELSEVETRQSTIIVQFNADTAQLTKAIADLRARRETELARATKWNAEEARIENAYKTKLAAYTNKKTAYEKDKADYDNANILKRQLLSEPLDPGVAPERESNTILKPTLIAELDAQINAKEAELVAVNNKRRDRVAQVDADARRLRAEFDQRSGTKREESDRKREALLAALAVTATEWKAEEKQIDQELGAAVQKVDGLRAEVDACRKKAEGFYEAREASIRNTQVHRIATTVEIVRGLLFGERPMSIKATAKERGDILTDQISMVRIWVYPVLAFIVAFLPTLMVEIGFATLFKPEQQRPAYRLGFLGRRLHWLYTRAGRQKILRAERQAREVFAQVAARDHALAAAKAAAEKTLAQKQAEVQAAHEAASMAAAEHAEQLKQKEDEWVAKFGNVADSLSRAVAEKDALRDFQKAEIERQVQLRQNAWSDRLTQLRQELDAQRAATETEHAALIQEHHKKLQEISETSKTQVMQARRQTAAAESAVEEKLARLTYDLKEAVSARDAAVAQLQQQTEALSLKLTQTRQDAARELEKAARQEKHRFERQQLEFVKTLRQRDEEFEHQLKQRAEESSVEFESRLVKEKTRVDEDARHREAELERQLEARVHEVDERWKQEVQQREEAAQIRLKQREQQLSVQAAQNLRRQESELERQFETQLREADARLKQELQQQELEFQDKLKQREQELTARTVAREAELQTRWDAELRAREEELAGQTEARVRATETRLGQEAQQKEELFQSKTRQRDQQWQAKLDAVRVESQAQTEQALRRREVESAEASQRALAELEAHLRQEMQQKEEVVQAKAKQREQQLQAQAAQELRRQESELQRQFDAQVREADARWKQELQQKELDFQAKLKQREQELTTRAGARETELQNQWAAELRAREEEWARQTEVRVRATETRLGQDTQQKEELFQSKSRQRDQQWQVKLDAVRNEVQAQAEQTLRRREVESADASQRALLELEAHLRKEMQQKEEAAQAKTKQREQALLAQLTAQAEASQMAAQAQWQAEAEEKTRATIEHFKAQLARAEMERDEAKQFAAEGFRQVQNLEKKLTDASSLLAGWKNGKSSVAAPGWEG